MQKLINLTLPFVELYECEAEAGPDDFENEVLETLGENNVAYTMFAEYSLIVLTGTLDDLKMVMFEWDSLRGDQAETFNALADWRGDFKTLESIIEIMY